jgi:hypothetical protein
MEEYGQSIPQLETQYDNPPDITLPSSQYPACILSQREA